MSYAMAITLGISPSANIIGLALFKEDMLLHWHTHTFPGKWNGKKFRRLLAALDVYMVENRVTKVAIKIPDRYARQARMTMLMGGINILCERADIVPKYYTLKELKQELAGDDKVRKNTLTAFIARTYPELMPQYVIAEKAKRYYYEKMFEAVLVGHRLKSTIP
jgi:hypothetical protein